MARTTGFAAGFILAFLCVPWAIHASLVGAAIETPHVSLDDLVVLDDALEPSAPDTPEFRIVYVADSLAMDPYPPDISIPVQLERMLAERAQLTTLIRGALGLFSQYFLSQRVAELQPDRILLAVNMQSFSARYLRIERAEIAGWLPARAWPQALGFPLEKVGVTTDRLLLYKSLLATGRLRDWRWVQQEQARAVSGWEALGESLQRASGLPDGLEHFEQHKQARRNRDFAPTQENRPSEAFARELLTPVLDGLSPDHYGLRLLDAMLGTWAAAGVPVLVYVSPMNVEFVRGIGVYDARGVAESLARIHEVAERNGASFMDLHALLGDASFRDSLDHIRHDRGPGGSREVALRLAAELERSGLPPGS